MIFFLLAFILSLTFNSFSQSTKGILLSGIVLNTDSLPVPDAAILNTRNGRAVRTNPNGFFETEIATNDSLLIYHIAYKRQFISEKDNGTYIVLEPEIQELMQIDITNGEAQELRNLEETVDEIKRLGSMKKLEGYDLKSRQSVFVEEHGTHNKGFSPFFGPTVLIPFGKIGGIISEMKKKKQLKKMTQHYHFSKRKK